MRRCAARAGFRKTIGFFGVISCWSYEENSWPELFIGERGAANEGMEIIFDHVAKTPRAPKETGRERTGGISAELSWWRTRMC